MMIRFYLYEGQRGRIAVNREAVVAIEEGPCLYADDAKTTNLHLMNGEIIRVCGDIEDVCKMLEKEGQKWLSHRE